MNKIFKAFQNQRGFSMIEIAIGAALSSGVVYGGYSVLTSSTSMMQANDGQGILDREFAAGTQLANNPLALKPYVGAEALGDCLTKHKNGNCAAFATTDWKPFPAGTVAPAPIFQTNLSANGSCAVGDPNKLCLVNRTMDYRWLCTAAFCSGLETRVTVTPLNKLALKVKPRVVTIKLDRRQFMSRDQLAFYCDVEGQSLTGIDYDTLRDFCEAKPESRCDLPHRTYQPTATNDCRAELNVSCGNGLSEAGLDTGAGKCAPPSSGRTVAGSSHTTDTETNTITKSDTATSTVSESETRTITNTGTDTVTTTSTLITDYNPPTATHTETAPTAPPVWTKNGSINMNSGGYCPGQTGSNMSAPNTLGPCTTVGTTCGFNVWSFGSSYVANYTCMSQAP